MKEQEETFRRDWTEDGWNCRDHHSQTAKFCLVKTSALLRVLYPPDQKDDSSLNYILFIIMAKSKKAKMGDKKRQTCVSLNLGCLKASHLQVGSRRWYFVLGSVVSRDEIPGCLLA